MTDDGRYILSPSTTTAHYAIIEYERDHQGIYHYRQYIDKYDRHEIDPSLIYAYCPKTGELLYCTTDGNYSATATKALAGLLKKDKQIAQLKPDEMGRPKNAISEKLIIDHDKLNTLRHAEISDSIKRDEQLRKEAQEQRRREQHAQEVELYRQNNIDHWRKIKINGPIHCDVCSENHRPDSILLIHISSNHWAYSDLSEELPILHLAKPLDSNSVPAIHLEAFADSLNTLAADDEKYTPEWIRGYNEYIHDEHLKKLQADIRKELPWGFIADWDWNDEYGMVTFDATFVNTSAKTIKYIEFHFVITNDVNDRRGSGVFKGTGPVEEWDRVRWSWDSSHYWVSGDASNMRITKVVLTYMDGSKKILSGKQLYINRS